MGVLDDLAAETLRHTIESMYQMVRSASGQTKGPTYATNVPCQWTDASETVIDATGASIVTSAKVRVLPSLSVNSDDRIVKNGRHYRVVKVEIPQPDFDGSIPYKILRVV